MMPPALRPGAECRGARCPAGGVGQREDMYLQASTTPAARAAGWLLSFAAGLLALGGCTGGGNASGTAPLVRAVNAVYGAPTSYDIVVDAATTPTASKLAYGQASAFAAVATGSASVAFEPSGTTTAAVTANFSAAAGTNYSVLAVQGSTALTTVTVAHNAAVVAAGRSQLTFVHAAPGTGALDLYVTTPTAALPTAATQTALAYAGDGASIGPLPQVVTAGDYRIRAVASGDTTRTVVFDSGPVTLMAGADALLAVVPVSGSAATFTLLSLAADGTVLTIGDQRVQVRVGNFAPATGGIDAYFDQNGAGNGATAPFATSVAQGTASAYQALLPQAYHVSFTSSGITNELVGKDLAFAAGTTFSVFSVGINGLAPPDNLQLLAVADDLRAPPSGMAKLRLIQLSPDIATSVDLVSIDTSGTTPVILSRLIVNLAYTGASTYVDVMPGSLTVALVPTGTSSLPLLPSNAGVVLSPVAGGIATLVVNGCRHPLSATCATASTPLQLVTLAD